ncbi:MAG: hypothetical protein AAF633_25635 [Chloroflexota bacterium]
MMEMSREDEERLWQILIQSRSFKIKSQKILEIDSLQTAPKGRQDSHIKIILGLNYTQPEENEGMVNVELLYEAGPNKYTRQDVYNLELIWMIEKIRRLVDESEIRKEAISLIRPFITNYKLKPTVDDYMLGWYPTQ